MKRTPIAALSVIACMSFLPAADARADFELSKRQCKSAVEGFLLSRMGDSHGARVRTACDAYPVTVSLRGGRQMAAWAVGAQAKSRIPNAGWTMYEPYTVIFVGGAPIGLAQDFERMGRR